MRRRLPSAWRVSSCSSRAQRLRSTSAAASRCRRRSSAANCAVATAVAALAAKASSRFWCSALNSPSHGDRANVFVGTFNGNGSLLTNLDYTRITTTSTGLVYDATVAYVVGLGFLNDGNGVVDASRGNGVYHLQQVSPAILTNANGIFLWYDTTELNDWVCCSNMSLDAIWVIGSVANTLGTNGSLADHYALGRRRLRSVAG